MSGFISGFSILFQEFDGGLSYIKSFSHFGIIVVHGVRVCSNFIALHAAVQVYQQDVQVLIANFQHIKSGNFLLCFGLKDNQ